MASLATLGALLQSWELWIRNLLILFTPFQMLLKCLSSHPGFRRKISVKYCKKVWRISRNRAFPLDAEDPVQNFAVQMKPKYHRAIVDLVLHYDWRSIIYIFQSSEGLYRLQKIYENIPKVSSEQQFSGVFFILHNFPCFCSLVFNYNLAAENGI